MTHDPSQPQPSPFAPPEPGPATGQPASTGQPMPPYAQAPSYGGQLGHPSQPVPSFIPPTVAAAVGKPKARTAVSAGSLAFVAAIVIAGAGLGFAGGRLTAPAAAANGRTGFGGNFARGSFTPDASGNPGRGAFGGLNFGGAAGNISIDGTVTAVSGSSITLQTASGQSVTLQIPSTATYHSQAAATSSDVAVGSSVAVSVSRPNRGAEASGQPAPSGQPGAGAFGFDVTDITVLSK